MCSRALESPVSFPLFSHLLLRGCIEPVGGDQHRYRALDCAHGDRFLRAARVSRAIVMTMHDLPSGEMIVPRVSNI